MTLQQPVGEEPSVPGTSPSGRLPWPWYAAVLAFVSMVVTMAVAAFPDPAPERSARSRPFPGQALPSVPDVPTLPPGHPGVPPLPGLPTPSQPSPAPTYQGGRILDPVAGISYAAPPGAWLPWNQ